LIFRAPIFLFGGMEGGGRNSSPATTIGEAMKMVSLDRPDIVLLDIMLKNENGLDIMEKLKKDRPAGNGGTSQGGC